MNFKNLIKFSPSFHCVQKLRHKHQCGAIKSQRKNKVNLQQPRHAADREVSPSINAASNGPRAAAAVSTRRCRHPPIPRGVTAEGPECRGGEWCHERWYRVPCEESHACPQLPVRCHRCHRCGDAVACTGRRSRSVGSAPALRRDVPVHTGPVPLSLGLFPATMS